jgi:hypothetical protein
MCLLMREKMIRRSCEFWAWILGRYQKWTGMAYGVKSDPLPCHLAITHYPDFVGGIVTGAHEILQDICPRLSHHVRLLAVLFVTPVFCAAQKGSIVRKNPVLPPLPKNASIPCIPQHANRVPGQCQIKSSHSTNGSIANRSHTQGEV